MVLPTRLPLISRRCHVCAAERFRASGKFRVNANHKLIDAWLLAHCVFCEETVKLTVLERVNVRSIRPELLDRLHNNDPGLIAQVLQDPTVQHSNRFALDWDDAWRLDTGEDPGRAAARGTDRDTTGPDHPDRPDHEAIDVSVRFGARIPVRPVRLIAEGCGLSRGEVERLLTQGKLVSVDRLSGRRSSDFSFTLKR